MSQYHEGHLATNMYIDKQNNTQYDISKTTV